VEVNRGQPSRAGRSTCRAGMTSISARAGARSPGSTAGGFSMAGRDGGRRSGHGLLRGAAARGRPSDADGVWDSQSEYFVGAPKCSTSRQRAPRFQARDREPLKMELLAGRSRHQSIVDMRHGRRGGSRQARPFDLTVLHAADIRRSRATCVRPAVLFAQDSHAAESLVPPRPGPFLGVGLLCTDVVTDYIRSPSAAGRGITPIQADGDFAQLEHQGTEELRAESQNRPTARFARELDLVNRPGL